MKQLRNYPGVAVAVIVTLGLGIAAATAVFSILSSVLLAPLPYRQPGDLALVRVDRPATPDHPLLTGAEYAAVTQIPAVVQAAHVGASMNLRLDMGRESRSVVTVGVGVDLFSMLGVRPVLGRDFRAEDRAPGPSAVIATWDFWQEQLGGARDALGSSLILGGRPYALVGVLPRDFELFVGRDARGAEDATLYFPSGVALDNTRFVTFRTLVRLRQNTDRPTAEQQLALLPARLAELDPENLGGDMTYRLVPLHEDEVAQARPAILGLLAAVALVVLLTCLNAASLLLARGARRAPEYAVRAALGASRGRLLAHSLLETTMLAAAAALLGMALGVLFLDRLLAAVPIDIPRMHSVDLDPRAFGLATLLAASVAGVAGLLPALQAARADPRGALRAAGNRVASSSRHRHRLVIAQIAVSLVLLLGSGLMIRTLVNLRSVSLGYVTEGLYTAKLIAPRPAPGTPYWHFFREAIEALHATPGVVGASAISRTPLAEQSDVEIVSFGTRAGGLAERRADLRWVLPGAFGVLQTPLTEGRAFTWQEIEEQRPVAVIDERMASGLWPGTSAIGREILIPRRWGGEPEPATVVGVVAHARLVSPRQEGRPQAFLPASHMSWGVMTLAVRSDLPAREVFLRIRAVAAQMNAANVYSLAPMSRVVAETTAATTVATVTVAGLGVTAAVATLVGLYSLLAFVIAQERREIGLRIALGADPARMVRRYVGWGARLTATGLVLGAVAAMGLVRLVDASLFGLGVHDPSTWAIVCAGFLIVALLAVVGPARSASRVDPVEALRSG